jgi:hypothetical protein
MTQKKIIKHLLLLLASSILIVIAGVTLSGSIQQCPCQLHSVFPMSLPNSGPGDRSIQGRELA